MDRIGLAVFAVLVGAGNCANAQQPAPQPEIFIGNAIKQPRPPKPTPENYLAKCLADPGDTVSCHLAKTAKSDGGLENHIRGYVGATSYVTCSKPGGVCLELATYDPGDAQRPATSAAQKRIASLDVTIQFDFDTASVSAAEAGKLKQLAAAMSHAVNAKSRFAIIGHTDSKGTLTYNCDLSRRRAKAVGNWLVTFGVPESKIEVMGAGERLLLHKDNGEAATNRRVGFMKVSKEGVSVVDRISKLCRIN